MFIFERIFALLIYLWVLCIICFLLMKLDKKYTGKLLFFYTLILSLMGFLFVPHVGADLYRLIPIMHMYGSLSLNELWVEMQSTSTPVYVLYMNMIGRTNIDGLLTAITAFLFYNNVFYIIKKSSRRYLLSGHDTALILFFFMSIGAFIEVISGIRTMLGFSVIAVCVYDEMVEGKSVFKNIVWYILVSMLHSAALALTMIRFSYLFFEKNRKISHGVSKALFLIIAISVVFLKGRYYVNAGFEKALTYLKGDAYSYLWEYIIGLISLLLIIYIQIKISKKTKLEGNESTIQNLLGFSKFLSLILLAIIFEYNIFHRFVIFLSIIALPMIAYLFYISNDNKKRKGKFIKVVFLVSCILLFFAISRGNLSSLKFFLL